MAGPVRASRNGVSAVFRCAPGAWCAFALLSFTTGLLAAVDGDERRRLLAASSTNLDRLSHHPIVVLLASAIWIPPAAFWLWGPLTAGVLAAVERRAGTRRTFSVFAAGHVGATLLVALGIWEGIRIGSVAPRVADSLDVGISYGLFAVIGYGACVLRPTRRVPVFGAVGAYLAFAAFSERTFTDFGHLFALWLGWVLWLVVLGLRTARPRRVLALAGAAALLLAAAVVPLVELPHPRLATRPGHGRAATATHVRVRPSLPGPLRPAPRRVHSNVGSVAVQSHRGVGSEPAAFLE